MATTARPDRTGAAGSAVAAAIATHFDGDAAIYDAFSASCSAQFAADIAAGQAACTSADLPTLRRLAHDLEPVLAMLGHLRLSRLASQVEQRAAAAELRAACSRWRVLRRALARLPRR